MKWSLSIGRAFGIPIRVHVTFALVPLLGALQSTDHGVRGAVFGAVAMLLLFGCVVLHELGHSVVALAFGIPVQQIILLPIGGVATLAAPPRNAPQEIVIAFAGPAVNLILALVLVIFGTVMGSSVLELTHAYPTWQTLVWSLAGGNMALAVFNLLPLFPLDGGRVFRAVLALFLGILPATRIAATVGQVAAIGLGVLAAVSGGLTLAMVAIFLFFVAGHERADARRRGRLSQIQAAHAHEALGDLLPDDLPLPSLLPILHGSPRTAFPVVARGSLVGALTRRGAVQALRRGGSGNVGSIMVRSVPQIAGSMTLDEVLRKLEVMGADVATVHAQDGSVLGLITADHVLGRVLATLEAH